MLAGGAAKKGGGRESRVGEGWEGEHRRVERHTWMMKRTTGFLGSNLEGLWPSMMPACSAARAIVYTSFLLFTLFRSDCRFF